ncbi:NADH-quinone oxidoreductase subunit A [Neoehrlichia mikurensis]|uniref:NADH-quinone oxidoreductase subunit A n=1 Tax=Neoehrlichia mikurensis TaxID=89586 RepID=A0A9Q9F3K2_9RICK|nr:NADH-quinone oxidoreductase subunit A [Neoehrlichia mikurensis]QXK92069.1 NADH-quinone oxidoreductase subunit A [Neoehrlichia mikurensis]QXK92526.1 NADH-quinone oxidoreductase subunit A [Neoehrlichia mikurensis]QXK93762.1 NADH-quinone oxidoreductase subunit A [Neoehrlichia mikurensis]UTO55262.1 NADH-quinone oxidoreductase subunit A [Neoehrlichia mikurensis]UTO56183.1 NADH-quinone oxidoreductase subunit A [Neoehrlichia mikurensis]
MHKVNEYLPILIFLVISGFISCLFTILPMFLANSSFTFEKLSPYECGFNPVGSSRKVFDVRFYLVAILFIIFDLEIAFLFPWSICLSNIGINGFLSMMIFLSILTIGFIYEWSKGALEWK